MKWKQLIITDSLIISFQSVSTGSDHLQRVWPYNILASGTEKEETKDFSIVFK